MSDFWLLMNIRECGQNTNVACELSLCAGGSITKKMLYLNE